MIPSIIYPCNDNAGVMGAICRGQWVGRRRMLRGFYFCAWAPNPKHLALGKLDWRERKKKYLRKQFGDYRSDLAPSQSASSLQCAPFFLIPVTLPNKLPSLKVKLDIALANFYYKIIMTLKLTIHWAVRL